MVYRTRPVGYHLTIHEHFSADGTGVELYLISEAVDTGNLIVTGC